MTIKQLKREILKRTTLSEFCQVVNIRETTFHQWVSGYRNCPKMKLIAMEIMLNEHFPKTNIRSTIQK